MRAGGFTIAQDLATWAAPCSDSLSLPVSPLRFSRERCEIVVLWSLLPFIRLCFFFSSHFQQHGLRTGHRATNLFYTREETQWVFCSMCRGKIPCPYSLNFSVFSFIMSAVRCQHLRLLEVTIVCIHIVFTSFIQFKGKNLEFIIKLVFSHLVAEGIRSLI